MDTRRQYRTPSAADMSSIVSTWPGIDWPGIDWPGIEQIARSIHCSDV
jgi:hypothetical protein